MSSLQLRCIYLCLDKIKLCLWCRLPFLDIHLLASPRNDIHLLVAPWARSAHGYGESVPAESYCMADLWHIRDKQMPGSGFIEKYVYAASVAK